MEPVGQLSEVEKLHLKPGPQENARGRERENLQCCHSDTFPVLFVSQDDATVKKKIKILWKNLIKRRQSQVKSKKNVSVLNCVRWVIFNPPN